MDLSRYKDVIVEIFQDPSAEVYVVDHDDSSYVEVVDNQRHNIILSLKIENNTIEIVLLEASEHISGTLLLKNVKNFYMFLTFININIEYIDVEDGSSSDINGTGLNMALLQIIIYGKSWYNRRGYVSDDIENEMRINDELRNHSLLDLLDKINTNSARIFRDFYERNRIRTIFIEGRIYSIEQLFNHYESSEAIYLIYKYVKNDRNAHDENYDLILELLDETLDVMDKLFIYSTHLSYDPEYDEF